MAESDAIAALEAALDAGVTFIDTADVYGDGRSERLVAKVLNARGRDGVFVATKAGRRLPQQTVAGYSYENLSGWIDRSLAEPRGRNARPRPAPLPADRSLLPSGGVRRA